MYREDEAYILTNQKLVIRKLKLLVVPRNLFV